MYQKRKTLENVIVMSIDIICLIISAGFSFGIRYQKLFGNYENGDQLWQISFMIAIYISLNAFLDFYYHFFRRGPFEELTSVIKQQGAFCIIWISSLYLLHKSEDLSRLVFGYFIVFNIIFTYLGHIILKQYLMRVYKHSKYSSRLLLVTTSDIVDEIIDNLYAYNEWSRILTGIVLLDVNRVGETIKGRPIVANYESIMEYLIYNSIDEVFVIKSDIRQDLKLRQFINDMENMGIIVDVNIDIFDMNTAGKRSLNRVGKYAVVTFARNIFSTRQVALKRALDIVGSIFGMIILAITTIIITPIIKLDSPGPVFFGQTRVGKNGRKFTFYKFRSMYQDAEKRKQELLKLNEMQGLMFKMENDPRITKVGKFIRKTSIDELPQFWNVLKGDMSLVGTRPPTVDEFERYGAKHKCRLSMTPGLTGLWQISGRSSITDFDEVVKLDMQYIDNWSILLDIKILLQTIKVVLWRKGSK